MMCDRAVEEMQRVKDDISSTLGHFSGLFNALAVAATLACTGKRALLLRKLHELHIIMRGVWRVADKHLSDVPPLPAFHIDVDETTAGSVFSDTLTETLDDDDDDSSDNDDV